MPRNVRLPSSRGPYLGPDGGHLGDLDEARSQGQVAPVGGFLFQAEWASTVLGLSAAGPGIISSPRVAFFPFRYCRGPWALAKASVIADTTAGSVVTALYSYTRPGVLAQLPHSRVTFYQDGSAQTIVTKELDSTVYIEANTMVFCGVAIQSGDWVLTYSALPATNLVSQWDLSGSELPGTIDLNTVPKTAISNTATDGLVVPTYLSVLAEEIL